MCNNGSDSCDNASSESCDNGWMKVYKNGPHGEVLFGDKSRLIQAVSTGASVRVQSGDNYFTSVQNLSCIEGEVYGQALFHISKANAFKFQVFSGFFMPREGGI